MDKSFKILGIISIFVLGVMSTFTGATYASFEAATSSGSGIVQGSTYAFNASANLSPVTVGNLIPLRDSLLSTAINGNNTCIDSRNYQACNLYQVILTNNGLGQTFEAYISTLTGTTVATGDIKYQLLTLSGGTYTAASDVGSISTSSDNYITTTSNNITSNITIALGDGRETPTVSQTYYLVLWLSDNGSNQPLTQNKKLNGRLTFVSVNGDIIGANFTS